MRQTVASSLVVLACLGFATPARADHKPIKGYKYCGTKDFVTDSWHYGPSDGAFLDAYARGMSCRAARRNVDGVKYSRTPPYRPYRTGYRCQEMVSGYEYSSVRCVKKNGKRAFRYITAA